MTKEYSIRKDMYSKTDNSSSNTTTPEELLREAIASTNNQSLRNHRSMLQQRSIEDVLGVMPALSRSFGAPATGVTSSNDALLRQLLSSDELLLSLSNNNNNNNNNNNTQDVTLLRQVAAAMMKELPPTSGDVRDVSHREQPKNSNENGSAGTVRDWLAEHQQQRQQEDQTKRLLLLQQLQLQQIQPKQDVASLLARMNENAISDIMMQRNDRNLLLELELARVAQQQQQQQQHQQTQQQQQQQQQQQVFDGQQNLFSPLRQLSHSTAASRMLLLEQLGISNADSIPNLSLANYSQNNRDSLLLAGGIDHARSIHLLEYHRQQLDQLERLKGNVIQHPLITPSFVGSFDGSSSITNANVGLLQSHLNSMKRGDEDRDLPKYDTNSKSISANQMDQNRFGSIYHDHVKNSIQRRKEYIQNEEMNKTNVEINKKTACTEQTTSTTLVTTTASVIDQHEKNRMMFSSNDGKKSKTNEDASISSGHDDSINNKGNVEYENNNDNDNSNNNETFPYKLYRMLIEMEESGHTDIVSFLPHGCAFSIHQPKVFASRIMPKYFTTGRLSSFQRQLNLYNFRRISEGPDKGGYWHEHFLKDCPSLCQHIVRRKSGMKSVNIAGAKVYSLSDETKPAPSNSSSMMESPVGTVPLLHGSNIPTALSNRLLLEDYYNDRSGTATSNKPLGDHLDRQGQHVQRGLGVAFADGGHDDIRNQNSAQLSNSSQEIQLLSLLLGANQKSSGRLPSESGSSHHDRALLQSLLIQQQQLQQLHQQQQQPQIGSRNGNNN